MKKKFFKVSFVIAFAAIVGYVMFVAQNASVSTIDELTLENIEALGQSETNPPSTYQAYKGTTGSGGTLLRYRYSDGTCHMTLLRNATQDGTCRNG